LGKNSLHGNLAYVDAVKSCQRGRKSGKDVLLLIYEGILTPTRLRIDAALEAFHARPEFEQIGLRAMFGNTANPITAKSWKKSMAAEPQPENSPRFRFEFANFLESYQPA